VFFLFFYVHFRRFIYTGSLEYHKTARNMPFVLANQTVPETNQKNDQLLDKVMTFFNIAVPLLKAAAFLAFSLCLNPLDHCYYPRFWL